jgi:putative transposase
LQAATRRALGYVAEVVAKFRNRFKQERHLIDRQTYKERRSAALAEWQAVIN